MSDSFITIVPMDVSGADAEELSRQAINWLTERQIVLSAQRSCILGEGTGYPPGPKYKSVILGDDVGLLGLQVNGLQIVRGRQAFDNGENGLEEVICPEWGANNIDADWGEAINSWNDGQGGVLMCKGCGKESSVADYVFNPTWGFGECALVFWNWPSLSPEFLDDIRKLLKKDIRVIEGKL